ncbi:MAG: coproporphyrinogen III oxidase, partial [Pseudomonadota bacterium]
WRSGEWAGAGPGAHGRIDVNGQRMATEAIRDPAAWLASVQARGHGVSTQEPVSANDIASEYLLMAMRLGEGADLQRFHRAGGEIDQPRLARLLDQKLLEQNGDILKAAPEGRLVLNHLLAEITA